MFKNKPQKVKESTPNVYFKPVLTLRRLKDNRKATRGEMVVDGITLHTLEEPWRDNQKSISCIPAGTYDVVPHGWELDSPFRFKRVYRLLGTEPRTAILIHAGNTVDDIEGCILVGTHLGTLNGKEAVLNSRNAMVFLRDFMGQKEFTLVIEGVDVD